MNDIQWLKEQHSEWRDLTSIIQVKSKRTVDDTESIEARYYISSGSFSV